MPTVDVNAPIETAWRLLRAEAQEGVDAGSVLLLSEHRPTELLLEVRMGMGFRVQHGYRLTRRGATCEIEAQVRPVGWRWRLSNVFLFGRGRRAIEAASEQGLINLKQATEAENI